LKIQYNRNRYYDYYAGRWLTHDPLGYHDGMNLYEYVQSNPINLADPFGKSGITPTSPWSPEPEPRPPIPERGWHDVFILTITLFDCHQKIDRSEECNEGSIKEIPRCSDCEWIGPRYESLGWRKREKIEERLCVVRYFVYKCTCCKWKLYGIEPRVITESDTKTVIKKCTFQRWYGWRWPP